MRNFLIALFLLMPTVVSAQAGSMQDMDMQNFMQAIQKVQECMQKTDRKALKELEQEVEIIGSEIEDLCGRGERDKAQAKAIKYSKMLMNNPTMKKMEHCSKMAKDFMPDDFQEQSFFEEFNGSDSHVCDDES